LKVIVFLWRWWSEKNKANEGGRRQSENEIYNFVCYYLLEFEKLEGNAMKSRNKWKPPPLDIYKSTMTGLSI